MDRLSSVSRISALILVLACGWGCSSKSGGAPDADAADADADAEQSMTTTIRAIQYTTDAGDGSYPSPLVGHQVTTTGLVIATGFDGEGSSFHISTLQGGPWNGVYVLHADTEPALGDEVLVTGIVAERSGTTVIHEPSVTILGSGNELPGPKTVGTGLLVDPADAEAYEGTLVAVKDVAVTQPPDASHRWTVDDGTGACAVDDGMHAHAGAELGHEYHRIVGVLDGGAGYSVNPRFEADVHKKDVQPVVAPLVPNRWTVFTWPYNAYLPEDPEGVNGHVGNACGYTVIARVLHYWQFPDNGVGQLQLTDLWGFDWDVDLESLELDYSRMPATLPPDASQTDYHETAKLFEAAGAVGETIRVWSTGNEVLLPGAFVDYFRYSETAGIVSREDHTRQEWIGIFRAELDSGRPMIIVGRTPDSPAPGEPGQIEGHWWICDGYNTAGEYHVDYGFDEIRGYYDIDDLGGIYTAYNRAVIGLMPPEKE